MARDAVARIVLRTRDLASRPLQRFRQRMSGLRGVVRSVGASLAAFFTVRTVSRFFTAAVSESQSFEEALAGVQAVSQASAEDMQRLRDAATRMGRDTTFNATQAAGAMETLSRAGLDTEQTLAALPEVLALARGNSIELAEAAGLVTQAAQGMGISFEESARVADVLTAAAQNANTDVQGLGQALSFAAPTAQALGISIERTAALIGRLADAGIDASRAGTSLNAIFSQFIDEGSKFRRELGDIGITTDDFADALRQLEAAGDEGADAINSVGREAGPALRALLLEGTAGLDEFVKQLENSEGAARDAQETMDSTLSAAIERLGSAWRTLQRRLGDDALQPLTEGIDELASGIADFVDSGRLDDMAASFHRFITDSIDGIRDFLHEFDFEAASDRAAQSLEKTGAALRTAGATARIVGAAFSATWNAINVAVAVVMAAITQHVTRFVARAASAAEALSRLGIVSEEAATRLRTQAGALQAATNAMVDHAKEAGGRFVGALSDGAEATRDLFGAVDDLNNSTRDATDATDDQIDSFENLRDVTEAAAAAVERAAYSFDDLLNVTNDAARAVAAAGQKLADAKQSANDLAEAFEELGVSTSASLREAADEAEGHFRTIQQSGEATRQELEQAFTAYAEAVIETGDATRIAMLQAEAATLGLSEALADVGQVAQNSGRQTEDAMRRTTVAADETAASVEDVGAAADEAGNQAAGAAAALGRMLNGVRAQFAEVGDAAAEAWDQAIERAATGVRTMRTFLRDLGRDRDRLNQQIRDEERALESLERTINSASGSTDDLYQIANMTTTQFRYLGEERLAGVRQAIANAQRELDRMRASAQGTLQTLQEELLQLQGREEALADLRRERRRGELQEQLQEAEAAGDQESIRALREALRTLDKIAREESQQRQQQQEQERRREQEQKRQQQERQRMEKRRMEAEQEAARRPVRDGPHHTGKTVTLRLESGESIDVPADQADEFIRALERQGAAVVNGD